MLKRLAVGGMAELFLAKDTRSDRMVVLKRILPYLAQEEEFLRMFLDEARIAASLRHQNIVELIELGHLEGSTFIAMEWVDGIDLRRVLYKEQERGGVLPVGIAAWLIARLCEGLFHAHGRQDADGAAMGIVHRDVSPQNVMISFRGDVKLVDFGIAKATAWMDRSKPGVIKGKFLYLAPEQLTQDKLDHRADLFSTGTLLYELTLGKTPFYRTSTEAVIYAVRMEEAEAPVQVRAGFPVMLSRIIMKCLMKDRARRYQTADELRAALEDFMRADAPTTRGDVVRYLDSLFGDVEERTSIFLPPGAGSLATPARPVPELGRFNLENELTVPLVDVPKPGGANAPRQTRELSLGGDHSGESGDATVTDLAPPRDSAATADLDSLAQRLKYQPAGSTLEDTAVSVSGARDLRVGDVLPDLVPTRPVPAPRRPPPHARPGPPVKGSEDELPEVISVVSAEVTVGLDASAPTPVKPARAVPVPAPPPLRTRAPAAAAPRRPVPIKRPVPTDADDFVSTVDMGAHSQPSLTRPDGQGRRVLIGIIVVSCLLLLALLALVLWPSSPPAPPATVPLQSAGSPTAPTQPPPIAPHVPPATPRHVKVTVRGPKALQVQLGGALLPGTSFEQAPGKATLSWKCRSRRGRLVEQSRTFEVPDAEAAIIELPCP